MKAILVIDEMPKSCYACPLTYIDYDYGANTTRCVIDKDSIPTHGKWDECPLKSLPQKYNNGIEYNIKPHSNFNGYLEVGFKMGWDACIDKITGDKE